MNLTEARFDDIRRLAERVPECAQGLLDQYQGRWAPESVGAIEAGSYSEIATAFASSVQALTISADHMFALYRSLQSPLMTFAPWTLARASIEASCLSRWLLDPTASPLVRSGRSLNLRLQSLRDQSAYLRSRTPNAAEQRTSGMLEHVAERVDHLVDIAGSEGIEVIRNRQSGRPEGFGERLPSTTDLLSLYGLADEFRLYSGVAHSRSWAILATGFKVVGPERLTQDMTPEAVISLVLTTVEGWLPPAFRCFEYAGWDLNTFVERCDEVLDRAGVASRLRPWRADFEP